MPIIYKFIIYGLLLAGYISAVSAAPYIPTNPSQILETLPENSSVSSKEFKNLRSILSADPTNSNIAARLAQLYIEQSRIEGDPRYLGYAQSALKPWWNLEQPPLEVLVLRATILQSTHHFDQSLVDLNKVLKQDPQNGQAWITRATILQVQGKYAEAYKSCEQLYGLATTLVTVTCATNIQSLNGHAVKSYQKLKASYAELGESNPSLKVWVLTLLAEMATRLDDNSAAEQYFKQALKLENSDSYLLGAYSDFLLDQKRSLEVIKLLETKTKVDALLLRYAEALKLNNSPKAPLQIETLKHRFAAAMLRGDTVHQREHSRFELRLMNNPLKALQLAKQNWAIQKEPADARVYLEAAIASNDNSAIRNMQRWLNSSKLEDVTLSKIIAQYNSDASK